MAKFRLPRKSLPKYRRPLTDEEKAKQVEDSKKAKKSKVKSRYRRRQQFRKAKAKDAADIKKTLKQIDKVKKPNVNKLKLKSRLTKTSKALKGNRAIQKAIGVGKHAGKLRYLKGLAKGGLAGGITMGADWAVDQVTDRAFKQLSKRTRGKNMSLKEYRAEMALMKQGKHPKQLARKKEKEAKNEAVTNPKPKTESKSKTKTESKSKTKDSAEKTAWLKKTRRSPAAKHFSDDERWELQQRHRAWKAARKKKKK